MMPDPLTPAERDMILSRVIHHAYTLLDNLRHTTSNASRNRPLTPEQEQFVRESIADACAAIDAAVAPVPTEEEIANIKPQNCGECHWYVPGFGGWLGCSAPMPDSAEREYTMQPGDGSECDTFRRRATQSEIASNA